mmetsp:Transcript_1112/g.3126  ORF Transcript_1112/g.3126 Transcript_1112/m.3126 type:complete len:205 (+) Transcript_1112:120-734(+)
MTTGLSCSWPWLSLRPWHELLPQVVVAEHPHPARRGLQAAGCGPARGQAARTAAPLRWMSSRPCRRWRAPPLRRHRSRQAHGGCPSLALPAQALAVAARCARSPRAAPAGGAPCTWRCARASRCPPWTATRAVTAPTGAPRWLTRLAYPTRSTTWRTGTARAASRTRTRCCRRPRTTASGWRWWSARSPASCPTPARGGTCCRP